jgi:hypothetical protein
MAQGTAGVAASAGAPGLETGQVLFMKFAQAGGGGPRAPEALEEVFAKGMPKTTQNTSALRSLLVSKTSNEEKVILTRLLAKQYAPDNPTGMNHLILQDLKQLANAADVAVAREATFAFSRLGYFPDYQDVLQAAWKRGTIDDDSYYGEFAHVLAFAPAPDQETLARVLRASKNVYASRIVAMVVNNAAVASKISASTRLELAAYLEVVEPRFAMALGQFDFVDAVRYSAWLRAVASLSAPVSNRQSAEIIMAKLSDANVDPRKVMAFLVSEFGPGLMSQIGQKARFEMMLRQIAAYSRQFPQNRDMKDIVEQARMSLSTLH